MTLGEYLEEKQIRQKDFAVTLGLSPGNVSSIVNGLRVPSGLIIYKIQCATGGRVTINDWYKVGSVNQVIECKTTK